MTARKMTWVVFKKFQSIAVKGPMFLPILLSTASAQTPEYYGAYARDAGRLVQLEQDVKKVNRLDFTPDVTFIIYDKWIAQPGGRPLNQAIVIKRQFFVRNHVLTNPFSPFQQSAPPVKPLNGWGAEEFEGPLQILLKPFKEQIEAVEAVPRERLSAGVYSLIVPGASFTFSVKFTEIRTDDHCVDMYADSIGAILGARSFRRCGSAGTTQAGSKPSDPRADPRFASLVVEGRRSAEARNWKAAEAAYRKLLELDPENFEAHANLGASYLALGLYQSSIFHGQKAMNLRPDEPNPYYNMACTYAKMGEIAKAIALLTQAVAKGFKDFDWMRRDPDLESIRNEPGFKSLGQR